jgi:hypothetical protein
MRGEGHANYTTHESSKQNINIIYKYIFNETRYNRRKALS